MRGYQSPSSYPADKAPDGSVISKPGYAFAGWYDNKREFSGEAVTKIDISYTGPSGSLCKMDGSLLLCRYSGKM